MLAAAAAAAAACGAVDGAPPRLMAEAADAAPTALRAAPAVAESAVPRGAARPELIIGREEDLPALSIGASFSDAPRDIRGRRLDDIIYIIEKIVLFR